MRSFEGTLASEFQRWLEEVGTNDNYETPKTLGIKEVLNAHFIIVDFFLADGGAIGGVGPKSLDLLHSALYRPHMCYGGVCKWKDDFEIFATLLYGLVMDHPFHDANKRTAFLSILYLLQKNNYTIKTSHKEFEDFLVSIAEHEIETKKRYQDYAKEYDDPYVQYIAWWLRRNTRRIDNNHYIITYRDLKRILNKFDCDIENPQQNYIDVVQYVEEKGMFGLGAVKKRKYKRGTIGFPGFTKEVPKGYVSRVRELTGLTKEKGIDSQVFFGKADPLDLLLAQYQEPLRRLADR